MHASVTTVEGPSCGYVAAGELNLFIGHGPGPEAKVVASPLVYIL